MDEKTFLIIVIALFIGFIVFFVSRSGENFGMLKTSETATDHFQAAEALPELASTPLD